MVTHHATTTMTGAAYHGWITGNMPGIKHEAYLASGASGQMLDERSGQVRGGRKLADGQVFARKILRIFGDLTREDVDNEATVVSQVCREGQSNSIVEVYDHGWLPGFDSSYYYVDMEFCSQTLEDWIYSRSGFNDSGGVNATDGVIDSSLTTVMHTDDRYTCTAEEILVILQNITSGLQYLHQNRLVHRDLKPRNILFSLRDQRWKLADFGTASQATSKRLNTTRFSRGTSSYRAPEILDDYRYNNKADMFALGCILYEIVTRKKLFSGDVAVWVYSSKKDPLVPRIWPDSAVGSMNHSLGRLAHELVEIEASKRPGAAEVARKLELIEEINRRKLPVPQSNSLEEKTSGNADALTKVGNGPKPPYEAGFMLVYHMVAGSGIGGYDMRDFRDRAFEFDYSHSGTPDHIALYRPGTGTLWIIKNEDDTFQPVYQEGCPGRGIGGYDLASPYDRVFAFDYEHSGKLDHLVLYRPGTGTLWILQNESGKFTPVFKEGCPGEGIGGFDLMSHLDRIFAFDFEHSGMLDHLVLYRRGAGDYPDAMILRNDDGVFTSVSPAWFLAPFRMPYDRLLAFDYGRSGKRDHILLYQSTTANLRVLRNDNGLFTPVFYRNGLDETVSNPVIRPVHIFPYDYDGTGVADHLVFYRAGTGYIEIVRNTGDGLADLVYGTGDQTQVPGTGIGGYDLLDGADRIFPFAYFPNGNASQLCLYRPGHGTFWIVRRF